MRFVLPALVLLFVAPGCPTDSCTPNDTRCVDNRVQICGSDQRWRLLEDCEELGGATIDWACCWQPGPRWLFLWGQCCSGGGTAACLFCR